MMYEINLNSEDDGINEHIFDSDSPGWYQILHGS
jgi:hypothetical protein